MNLREAEPEMKKAGGVLFFKKEPKNVYPGFAPVAPGRSRSKPRSADEVFLLLFLQKKKILSLFFSSKFIIASREFSALIGARKIL